MSKEFQRPYPGKPYRQNALFTGGSVPRLNACVGTNGGPYELSDYAEGYRKGGRAIADTLREKSHYVDLMVYPLVFNYRQAVELYLKALVARFAELGLGSSRLKHTHRLLDNWDELKSCLLRHASMYDPEGTLVPEVELVLRDLVEIDPSGEAFRFPHERWGDRFLQQTSLINTDVFADIVDRVAEVMEYWLYVSGTAEQ